MPIKFRTLLSALAACLGCAAVGHSTTLTTSGLSADAAYATWETMLTGTPTDVSVPSGSGSYNTSAGISIGADAVTFTVSGIDPQGDTGYYLSLLGNALTDSSDPASQMNIALSSSQTGLLFQVQNSPDPSQSLTLTLSDGSVLTIPGSVTYFGVVSSTPLIWADIVSYNGTVVLRDISYGNADLPQAADEGNTAGMVATGIAIFSRAFHTRMARLQADVRRMGVPGR